MSHPRRSAAVLPAALFAVLIAGSLAGCAPGEPPPSCGAYNLDKGEPIPQEAVDCMSESDEDGALMVVAPPDAQGYTIATTYEWQSTGGILVTTEWVKEGGASFMTVCPHAASVIGLGVCEELHEGD